MAKQKRKLSAYQKHVQREMKAGKTMKQAAASWKKRGVTAKRSPRKALTKPKRTVRKIARRKKSRKNSKKRIPIIPTAVGALYGISLLQGAGTFEQKLQKVQADFTGFSNGSFNWANLKVGLVPMLFAVVVSRMIGKARLQPDWPIVRL